MVLFYKSAEDYLKQIIRIAIKLKARTEKENYSKAIKLLQSILKINAKLYEKIEEETKSKALYEQCLAIRSLAEEALKKAEAGDYSGIDETINAIVKAGEKYLLSEERFRGYKYEELKKPNIREQAKFLSELIAGITNAQAQKMLEISYENGLDLVIGGSSVTTNQIGGDLDVGFKISKQHEGKIDTSNLRAVVARAVNKINKKCFPEYRKKGGLIKHKWLHDRSALQNMPDIENVEEFFVRRGFRYEPKVAIKDGRPFGPSSYAVFRMDGRITLVTPIIKKGVVGEVKFW